MARFNERITARENLVEATGSVGPVSKLGLGKSASSMFCLIDIGEELLHLAERTRRRNMKS